MQLSLPLDHDPQLRVEVLRRGRNRANDWKRYLNDVARAKAREGLLEPMPVLPRR